MSWMHEARTGAARAWGARHYRGFAAFEAAAGGGRLLRRVIVPAVRLGGVLVLVGAVGRVAARWSLLSLPWLWIGAGVLVVLALVVTGGRALVPLLFLGVPLAGLVWLVWLAFTAWSLPWLWLAL